MNLEADNSYGPFRWTQYEYTEHSNVQSWRYLPSWAGIVLRRPLNRAGWTMNAQHIDAPGSNITTVQHVPYINDSSIAMHFYYEALRTSLATLS